MKVFLLFLVLSFIIGANQTTVSPQRQRWLMGGIVVVLSVTYFFFEQLI